VRVLALVVAAGAAAASLAGCGGGGSGGSGSPGPVQHPKSLVGDVGHNDAFTISFKDENGAAISNLAAGTYQVTIKDESSIHDFHLKGSGVDKATSVSGIGATSFTVTFAPGKYSFLCDPHASQMHGSFTVS